MLGERIWPRDPEGWLCEPCGVDEQPTVAAQLAARLNYRIRAGMTASLDPDERAAAAEAFDRAPANWRPSAGAVFITDSELRALRALMAEPRAIIDTRRAAALHELLHATVLPPIDED